MTKKPWFGARRYVGPGWSLSTRQGRIVAGLFLLLAILSAVIWGAESIPAIAGLLLVYLVVVVFTDDIPGRPRRPGNRPGDRPGGHPGGTTTGS